jgi:hypothetical protein
MKNKNIFWNELTRNQICNVYADFLYSKYGLADFKDWDFGYKLAKELSDSDLIEWVKENSDTAKKVGRN